MVRSLVENSSDSQQIARAQRIVKARDRAYRTALTTIAHTPDGELLFEMIVERARFFATSFDANPQQMAFNEGERNMGLKFLADWTLARPDAMAVLLAKRATEERHG